MTDAVLIFQQGVLSLEGLLLGIFFPRMLHLSRKNLQGWRFGLLCWCVYVLAMLPNWIMGDRLPGILNTLSVLILFQIVLKICCSDRLQVRIFAALLLYLMQALADILISLVFVVFLQNDSVNYMQDNMAWMLCVGVILEGQLDWAACRLWRSRTQTTRKGFLVAGAGLTVLFFYLLFLAGYSLQSQAGWNRETLLVVFASLLAAGLAVLLTVYFQQKQHSRQSLEMENLERLRLEQEAHFRKLEGQEKQTSFVRHDQLNVLGAADQLLREDQPEEAENLLQSWLNRLEESS